MTRVSIRSWIIGIAVCCLVSTVFASTPRVGVSLSVPLVTKDPEYLHGYQLTTWYHPKSLTWQHLRLYLDASIGHWWVTNTNHNHSLNIYSVSPVLRYYFFPKKYYFSPFFNLGIGLAYLSRTRLDDRRLGMHFAFQDQIGFGASFGKNQQLSFILSALHYSNGSLCAKNAGITVPLEITGEYAFA